MLGLELNILRYSCCQVASKIIPINFYTLNCNNFLIQIFFKKKITAHEKSIFSLLFFLQSSNRWRVANWSVETFQMLERVIQPSMFLPQMICLYLFPAKENCASQFSVILKDVILYCVIVTCLCEIYMIWAQNFSVKVRWLLKIAYIICRIAF